MWWKKRCNKTKKKVLLALSINTKIVFEMAIVAPHATTTTVTFCACIFDSVCVVRMESDWIHIIKTYQTKMVAAKRKFEYAFVIGYIEYSSAYSIRIHAMYAQHTVQKAHIQSNRTAWTYTVLCIYTYTPSQFDDGINEFWERIGGNERMREIARGNARDE